MIRKYKYKILSTSNMREVHEEMGHVPKVKSRLLLQPVGLTVVMYVFIIEN